MRPVLLIPVIAGTLVLVADAGHAFDGKRSGFLLGFGLGAGMSHYTYDVTSTYTSSGDASDDEFGVASEFKIGAGIGERFQLYYVNRANWFSATNRLGDDETIATGVGLLGVSYYFEETAPSFYLLGTVGLSSWDAPFEEDSEALVGFGIGGGVGWEFKRHWSLEATLSWGNPSNDEAVGNFEADVTTVLVTINGIAY
jgi:hypothetical protein